MLWSLSSGSAAPASTDQPWFDRSIVGTEIGPTGAQFGYSDTNDTHEVAIINY